MDGMQMLTRIVDGVEKVCKSESVSGSKWGTPGNKICDEVLAMAIVLGAWRAHPRTGEFADFMWGRAFGPSNGRARLEERPDLQHVPAGQRYCSGVRCHPSNLSQCS